MKHGEEVCSCENVQSIINKRISHTVSCCVQMHIVHIKEEYSCLAEAVKDPAGVAVLGFFFEVNSQYKNV